MDKNFQPFSKCEGEEFYQNGIFEFNITKLLTFITTNPDIFQPELVSIKVLRKFVSSSLDEATIQTADIKNPILLAEIAPDKFNVIDGNHRLERAYRDEVEMISTYKVYAEQHIDFLASVSAYENYIRYWHEKIKE